MLPAQGSRAAQLLIGLGYSKDGVARTSVAIHGPVRPAPATGSRPPAADVASQVISPFATSSPRIRLLIQVAC